MSDNVNNQDPVVDPKDDDAGRQDPQDGVNGGQNDDADDDDDADDEPTNGKTYSKADIDKATKRRQAALDRARAAEKELAELKKQHATEEERLKIEAEEKAAAQAAKFKPALVKSHISYEMAFLGLTKTQIEQLVKFVDMENIEVELDDNSVAGVEEEVEKIKATFPALFPEKKNDADEDEDDKPRAPKQRRTPKGDGGPKPRPEPKKTSRERLIDKMQGNRK